MKNHKFKKKKNEEESIYNETYNDKTQQRFINMGDKLIQSLLSTWACYYKTLKTEIRGEIRVLKKKEKNLIDFGLWIEKVTWQRFALV